VRIILSGFGSSTFDPMTMGGSMTTSDPFGADPRPELRTVVAWGVGAVIGVAIVGLGVTGLVVWLVVRSLRR
jgi:hypothetical protein